MKECSRPALALAVFVAAAVTAVMDCAVANSPPSASTPQAATKTIVIRASTRSVSVFENDTVLFKVGTKQFALKFDGNAVSYDLKTLAPRGVLDHTVRVNVAPNPLLHEQGIP
jgi:hypothetical protein